MCQVTKQSANMQAAKQSHQYSKFHKQLIQGIHPIIKTLPQYSHLGHPFSPQLDPHQPLPGMRQIWIKLRINFISSFPQSAGRMKQFQRWTLSLK